MAKLLKLKITIPVSPYIVVTEHPIREETTKQYRVVLKQGSIVKPISKSDLLQIKEKMIKGKEQGKADLEYTVFCKPEQLEAAKKLLRSHIQKDLEIESKWMTSLIQSFSSIDWSKQTLLTKRPHLTKIR